MFRPGSLMTMSDEDLREIMMSLEWGAVAHVWYVKSGGRHGVSPGSFSTHLCNAIMVADNQNLRNLSLGFSDYVRAWQLLHTGRCYEMAAERLRGPG